MKKEITLTETVKIHSLMLVLFLSLALFSCGNERQDTMDRENGMMDEEEMQEDGMDGEMMQDSTADGGMMDGGMGMMDGGMMGGEGMMSEEMRQAMMSRGMGPEMMEDMMPIRQLLMQHEKISRRVENLENGVKTWTTSEDPQLAAAIQKHVRQMKDRMKEKKPIRQMDPVFRELFDNADKVKLEYEDLENGIAVVETSEDPQVVLLIQQHANEAVSEFVKYGMKRAMKPTPLPEGYQE